MKVKDALKQRLQTFPTRAKTIQAYWCQEPHDYDDKVYYNVEYLLTAIGQEIAGMRRTQTTVVSNTEPPLLLLFRNIPREERDLLYTIMATKGYRPKFTLVNHKDSGCVSKDNDLHVEIPLDGS